MLELTSSSRARRPLARRGAVASMLIVGVLAGGAVASAQQAPATTSGWTQFQGGPGHAGAVATGPTPPYREAWSFPVAPGTHVLPDSTGERSVGVTAPVISGTTVIAVGAEGVYGVNLESGQQEWSIPRQGPPSPPAVVESGGRSLLLFTDVSSSGTGELRAVDLRTRKEAWDAPVPLSAVSRSGVAVQDGVAFLGDADGTVYAVDVATGRTDWKVDVGGEPKGPPAIADGKVFIVPLSHTFSTPLTATVVALDASTGTRVWTFTPQPPAPFTSLAAAGDGSVVVVAPQTIGNGEIFALSTTDRALQWSARINTVVFPFVAPAVTPETVYAIDANGGLHAVARGASSESWQFQFNERVLRTSPVVVGDHVIVGLGDGTLAAVDGGSGHLVWRSPHLPGVVGPIAVGSDIFVAAVGGNHGGLVAFRHDANGTLVDERSPTVPRWGAIVGTFAIAAVAVGLVITVPLTLVVRRVGPPRVEGADDEDEDDDDDDPDDAEDEDGDR